MQLRSIILAGLLSCFSIALHAQSTKHLPLNYSVALGGGVTLTSVEGDNKTKFFDKNGNRAGYHLMGEGRYYFLPYFALGLQYDYLRLAKLPDKMHLHYIHPNITLRHLLDDGRRGLFVSLGIGYMNYRERTYHERQKKGFLFRKGYCGLSLGLGYEFCIAGKLSGMVRADVLTTDWFVNPDARLFNPDPDEYDDINHHWFKNNVTFFDIGVAVQWGR